MNVPSRAVLSPLAILVLALLREGDMHRYEMMRRMRERHDDRLVSVSPGTLYHTVNRLEEQGLVVQLGTDREGKRPERIAYSLTHRGQHAFENWIRDRLPRIDRPIDYRVALAAAHNLERSDVIPLLRTHLDALTEEIARYQQGLKDAASENVLEQYLLEVSLRTALMSSEAQWLQRLLDRLSEDDLQWAPPILPFPQTARDKDGDPTHDRK